MKKREKNNDSDKKYFNSYELDKIKQLGDKFGYEARKDYEEYFLKYPKDYTSYPFFASFLIKYRKLDDAEKILDYGFNLADMDSRFKANKEKYEYLKKHYILYKLKILFYREDYQGVLDLYDKQYGVISSYINVNNAFILYCQKMIGSLGDNWKREDLSSYLYRQIVEYREDDFKDHIKKHLADDAIDMDEASPTIFVPEFPVDRVMEEVKKYVPSDKCTYPGGLEDSYVFKYDECGRDRYCMTDYFKVFCFHNTSNFITISPTIIEDVSLQYIDLNYLKKEDNYALKKKSQIEKFYQKYKKHFI